jgi:hypothetical protein
MPKVSEQERIRALEEKLKQHSLGSTRVRRRKRQAQCAARKSALPTRMIVGVVAATVLGARGTTTT